MAISAGALTRLRAACARGWSVREMRGKIFLSVRSGAGGTKSVTATLPLAWTTDQVQEAIALIHDLHAKVEAGMDLRDALGRSKTEQAIAQPAPTALWPQLVADWKVAKFRIRKFKETTWESSYAPFYNRVCELMSAPNPPADAYALGLALIAPWAENDNHRTRELAIDALKRLLDFGVDTRKLPAASWTLSDLKKKELRGPGHPTETVATFTDAEILHLIDSLPKTEAGGRWSNALKLMALYGLRPAELKFLSVHPHPQTGTPALKCHYKKAAQRNTKPRWLMPLPLTDAHGEVVEWNLAGAMAIQQLPLPPLGDKSALRVFLMRQPAWRALREKYAAINETAKPYSFRNSYSLRGHQRGHRNNVMSEAMGHSLSVHENSYVWAKDASVLEFIP